MMSNAKVRKYIWYTYKKLSETKYAYMKSIKLVPIYDLINETANGYGVEKENIEKEIYYLYLEDLAKFEYGDKKENNFKMPSGIKYYYIKIDDKVLENIKEEV